MNLQLKRLRKQAGFKTQAAMAHALGIKERTYASWERQEAVMSFAQACDIADILGCTLDELAGRDVSKLPGYADSRQEQLNADFAALSEKGKAKLAEHAGDLLDAERFAKNEMQSDSISSAGVA